MASSGVGMDQPVGQKNQRYHDDQHHIVELDPVHGVSEPLWHGDAGHTQGAVGKISVLDNDADDLPQAHSGEGQEHIIEPQRRETHQRADEGGQNSAAQEAHNKRHAKLCGQQGRGISSHTVEAHMAHGKDAGVAHQQVKADGQHDVNAAVHRHLQHIAAEQKWNCRQQHQQN